MNCVRIESNRKSYIIKWDYSKINKLNKYLTHLYLGNFHEWLSYENSKWAECIEVTRGFNQRAWGSRVIHVIQVKKFIITILYFKRIESCNIFDW